MPANKYALLRYRIIDRCLTNPGKPFPSREDLRDACEEALYGSGGGNISLSTIDKDIWAMKNEGELGYYAPIIFDRNENGYCYKDPSYTISNLSLADEELEAIRFAAATLDQFRDVPIFRQYESAIAKIINRVNISARPDDSALEKFVQFEKSTVSRGNEFLGPLLDAIRHRTPVRISYRKFTDDRLKEYELHPYLLKEYHNRWYLVAFDMGAKQVRTFGVERLEALERGEKKFAVQPGFDPDIFFKHSIGITEKKEKPQDILLSFHPVAGKFLLTQPVHPSQQLVLNAPNEIRLSLHVLITPELLSFILGYGPQVQVIKPASLRKQVAAALAEAMDRYRD
ncbi:MAG: WYL domain-containing protein [Flavobacteriales bacterium]|nr:WYL domain-containing protein [Flavobacteriales bacterium]